MTIVGTDPADVRAMQDVRIGVARTASRLTLLGLVIATSALFVPSVTVTIDVPRMLPVLAVVMLFHAFIGWGDWEDRWPAVREGLLFAAAASGAAVVVLVWFQNPLQSLPTPTFLTLAFVLSAVIARPRHHLWIIATSVVAILGAGSLTGRLTQPDVWTLGVSVLVGALSFVGANGSVRSAEAARASRRSALAATDEARATSRALRAVVDAATRATVTDPQSVLEAIVTATQHLEADATGLYLRVDGGKLRLMASHRLPDYDIGEEIDEDQGVVGEVVRTGELVHVTDYPSWHGTMQPFRSVGVLGVAGVPIRTDGVLVGILVLSRYSPGGYHPASLSALRLLADHAGRVISLTEEIGEDRRTLARLERLRSIQEDFVATVSHELRTPLAIVAAAAETLDRHGGRLADDLGRELVGRLKANANALGDIVTSMLDSAALDRGLLDPDHEHVVMADLVRESVDRLHPTLAEHDLELVITSQRPVIADRLLLERVVTNLVTNLVRHTPAGTTATLEIADVGRLVLLSISDQGPGIPAHALPTITQRFTRAASDAPTTRGLGLGLALCDQILRLHGSRLEVESREGHGATFRFGLPAVGRRDQTDDRLVSP